MTGNSFAVARSEIAEETDDTGGRVVTAPTNGYCQHLTYTHESVGDMPDRDQARDWGDIDEEDDPEVFAEYLETVTGTEAVLEYKRRSHRLLHPQPGDRILDVGCGTGQDVLMLAELVGPEGSVVGIDNSEAMVETARQQAGDVPTVSFDVDDAVDLSFPDDHFDAARMDRVLQHLDEPMQAVRELRRVTRPGGRVGITDSDWETATLDTPTGHTDAFLQIEHASPRHPRTGRRLYRFAREAGLTGLDIDPWTGVSTELDFIAEAIDLDGWTATMEANGVASSQEIEAWRSGLREADERDQLFGSLTGFTVVGTVPDG